MTDLLIVDGEGKHGPISKRIKKKIGKSKGIFLAAELFLWTYLAVKNRINIYNQKEINYFKIFSGEGFRLSIWISLISDLSHLLYDAKVAPKNSY